MLRALRAVDVWPGPAIDCGFADPCLENRLRFDDRLLTDEACQNRRLPRQEIERIAAVLDRLAEAPAGPCVQEPCAPRLFFCNDGNDVGGDGCSATCVPEVTRTCNLGASSQLALQLPESSVSPVAIRGTQELQVAESGPLRTLAIRDGDVSFDPVPIPGFGCLCLNTKRQPLLGANLVATGLLDCSLGSAQLHATSVRDRDTTPGSRGNRGGLMDDPECDDTVFHFDLIPSRACQEGIDPQCGAIDSGRCRSPLDLRVQAAEPAPGSGILIYNFGLRLLADDGTCQAMPASDCPFEDYGEDCTPCTADDAGHGLATLSAAVTGEAQASLFDAGDPLDPTDIDSGQTAASGALFDCDTLSSDAAIASFLASGSLGAAVPVIDLADGGPDAVATLRLQCSSP